MVNETIVEQNTAEYMRQQGFTPKTVLGHLFLEQNTFASFINGAATAVTIGLIFVYHIVWPFLAWLVVIFLHSFIKTIYWGAKIKQADKEIDRLDKELMQLTQEINKKQAYFSGLQKKKGAKGDISSN